MNNIREIVHEERSRKGESVEVLAAIVGTSYSTLSRWVNGKPINSDIVEKILDHYDLAIVKKF